MQRYWGFFSFAFRILVILTNSHLVVGTFMVCCHPLQNIIDCLSNWRFLFFRNPFLIVRLMHIFINLLAWLFSKSLSWSPKFVIRCNNSNSFRTLIIAIDFFLFFDEFLFWLQTFLNQNIFHSLVFWSRIPGQLFGNWIDKLTNYID